jgi:hypothetical protein
MVCQNTLLKVNMWGSSIPISSFPHIPTLLVTKNFDRISRWSSPIFAFYNSEGKYLFEI